MILQVIICAFTCTGDIHFYRINARNLLQLLSPKFYESVPCIAYAPSSCSSYTFHVILLICHSSSSKYLIDQASTKGGELIILMHKADMNDLEYTYITSFVRWTVLGFKYNRILISLEIIISGRYGMSKKFFILFRIL